MKEEKAIRTPKKNMILCTVVKDDDGRRFLHKKDGKKEDDITLEQFLEQYYANNTPVL